MTITKYQNNLITQGKKLLRPLERTPFLQRDTVGLESLVPNTKKLASLAMHSDFPFRLISKNKKSYHQTSFSPFKKFLLCKTDTGVFS